MSEAKSWKLTEIESYKKLCDLQGIAPEDHQLYFRTNEGGWCISDGERRVAVADFLGKSRKRSEGYIAADPEGLANAHLIAAAPAMYEALEACIAGLRGDCHPVAQQARIRKAESALKSARGEA